MAWVSQVTPVDGTQLVIGANTKMDDGLYTLV